MSTISVIVPVYNVEQYLDRCLASLVAQTHAKLEIILVNDGSSDKSGEICEAWAAKDSRINVLHKKNGGLSDARNSGMRIATGKYLAFLDSDDHIEPRMFELLYKAISNTQAEIAECKFSKFSDLEAAEPYNNQPFKTEVFTPEEALFELIKENKLRQTVCNKLYLTKLAKRFTFEFGKICEDEFWTYQVFAIAKNITFIDVPLYHYYQRYNSIINSPYSPRRLVALDAYQARMQYMQEHFPRLYEPASNAYLFACLFHYQTICRNASIDPDYKLRQGIHARFCAGDYELLHKSANLKYKIWYSAFKYFPLFTCKIRNLLKVGL